MAKSPKTKKSDEREDEVLRRMLETPPKLHSEIAGKKKPKPANTRRS